MGYYLQENPNPHTAQYGWERAKIGQPGTKLSGVVGVHTSQAPTDFEGPDYNAENNAAFIARRVDHGSYTTTADYDSILPLVHPRYAAWADITNNAHAMSVSGCLEAARWLEMTEERRNRVTINMGIAIAREMLVAVSEGYLAAPSPAVRISAAEAISGSRPGFYGHGETNPGTRYDPGQHFNWDLFLQAYSDAINGKTTMEEDMSADMPMKSKDGFDVTLQDVLNSIDAKAEAAYKSIAKFPVFDANVRAEFDVIRAKEAESRAQIAALTDAVTALATAKEGSDPEAILATIEAGMDKFRDNYQVVIQRVDPQSDVPAEEPAS